MGMAHIDHPSVYIFPEKYILLVIQAAEASVKNEYKSAPFHADVI